jgi:hypothetical protein
MEITVTQAHIDAGIAGAPGSCPIALAIKSLKPEYIKDRRLGVGLGYVHIPERRSIPLPRVARDFIRAFDDGKKVEPFTFTLED